MSRVNLQPGQRFSYKGSIFSIEEILIGNNFRVHNHTLGGVSVMLLSEILDLYKSEELIFESNGENFQDIDNSNSGLEYTYQDFSIVPEKYRAEAWRRYELILPLLKLPKSERTTEYIKTYVKKEKEKWGYNSENPPKKPLSVTSIQRWLRDFVKSGMDIMSLVPEYFKCGSKGKRKLHPEVEKTIDDVFDICDKNRRKRRLIDIWEDVRTEINKKNRTLPEDKQLNIPSERTIYRRLKMLNKQYLIERKQSRTEKIAKTPKFEGPKVKRILERVEIDHTVLDIMCVDYDDRLLIGRPTITVCLDKASRMVLGFYVSYEPPSYNSVMQCLLHAILPKVDVKKIYGTKNDWPVYGLPEVLIVDNGKEFLGRSLKDACARLGIILEVTPVRSPWFKASVERFFRTLNTELLHLIPGTTFSNPTERGDYDSENQTIISKEGLEKVVTVFIVDYYSQNWHRGLENIPYLEWMSQVKLGYLPELSHSKADLEKLLALHNTRALTVHGIEFETLFYQNKITSNILSLEWENKPEVVIKIDPEDISKIYVLDPTAHGKPIQYDAIDQEYTKNLSIWKHRIIRKNTLKRKGFVDMDGLAETKKYIQEIIENEYRLTKSKRGRKTMARFLDDKSSDTEAPDENITSTSDSSSTQADQGKDSGASNDTDDSDFENWGGFLSPLNS